MLGTSVVKELTNIHKFAILRQRKLVPLFKSWTIFCAVANDSFMVVAITPTGPCFTQPLQYKPTRQIENCNDF